MPTVNIKGARFNYLQINPEAKGDCEDLVMIHGLATNLAFWGLHYAPFFSKRYRVTIYDLRGHGRSEVTESGYTPCEMAGDLLALLDHLGIRKAHFLAHSFGGIVALKLACLVPDRISSLILADTHVTAIRNIQKNLSWDFGERFQPVLRENNLTIDTQDPYFGYRLLTEAARLQVQGQYISSQLKEFVCPLMGKFGRRTSNQWLKLMDTTKAEEEMMGDDSLSLQSLSELRFPILAVYGEKSQAMLTGGHLLDVWSHADFRCVRNAGHFFPSTRSDEFIKYCKQFWIDAKTQSPPRRKGESVKSFFRMDRIYRQDEGWFFSTREEPRKGPYTNFEDAKSSLQTYVAEMAA